MAAKLKQVNESMYRGEEVILERGLKRESDGRVLAGSPPQVDPKSGKVLAEAVPAVYEWKVYVKKFYSEEERERLQTLNDYVWELDRTFPDDQHDKALAHAQKA